MTREDVKDLLKFIIRKCDIIINNESYTADDHVQDNIEDIAEICHRVLGGQFGEIVSNSEGPDESLEEAANNYASKTECAVVAYRGFKAGAEWREKPDAYARRYSFFNKGVEEGKRLMMEDAVEGEVIVPIYEGDDTWSTEIKIPCRYEIDDKVRIIIIKED